MVEWIIGGGLTLMLMGGFIWWTKKWMTGIEVKITELEDDATNSITDAINKFTAVADKLDRSINALDKVVDVLCANVENDKAHVKEKFNDHDNRIGDQEKTLKIHDTRITRIETTCELHHDIKLRK